MAEYAKVKISTCAPTPDGNASTSMVRFLSRRYVFSFIPKKRLMPKLPSAYWKTSKPHNQRGKSTSLRIMHATTNSKLVQAYLATEGCRIQIHFLPPYSPNLNLIERLWGFFKREVIYGTYYDTFVKFKNATLGFFRDIGKHHQQLSTLMTDNFRVVKI
ncbi:transposase [Thiothrix litoralis]|jgi:transposase|uniref:Transposase n=2 Tax=Thiothrix litoralis TaxID=2891210 RepID=A0ABX7WSS7_9GAMM|nr:transposase [Thiothrix litoralis]QTR46231.1 transposase [Thiothrix litoralis]